MTTPSQKECSVRELRWIADAYEQAQQIRIQTGERIRAIAQGRDALGDESAPVDADQLLHAIRSGDTDGPVPILGRTHRRHWEEEREMARSLGEHLRDHPAWPWISQVRGIGPTLAGKLLARLDIKRANTPSSFWAYCGLATVPGTEYRCETCGLRASFPARFRVSGTHQRPGSKRRCTGALVPVRGPADGARTAQPKPQRGERAPYDQYAKKICYLIGTSFLKARGPYEQFYRRERARLNDTRPGWTEGRKHLAALRKTEKLFLAHLWLVWREAESLPTTQPYAQARHRDAPPLDPWEVVACVDNNTSESVPTGKPRRASPAGASA